MASSINDWPVVEECLDSPEAKQEYFQASNSTGRIRYLAKGYDDWDSAFYAVKAKAPETYGSGNLTIKTITVKPYGNTDNIWDAVVEYGYDKADLTDHLKHRGSTTGGTKHINSSLRTQLTASAYQWLPTIDFGGAIGVTEKGDIEGVDVKCPTYNWSVTLKYSIDNFTQSVRRYFMRMTGRINSAAFWGFHAGEVLFDGIDWELTSTTSDETGAISRYYLVTFNFSVMENQYGTCIGNLVFDKRGWDYAWVFYGSQTDGKTVTKYPRNVCIEQVYPEADFNDFGIPELA